MKKIFAFTMAEVTVTLAIIGVVASMTIMPLVKNYQKQVYVTQLKKVYNDLNTAFKKAMLDDRVDRMSKTRLIKSFDAAAGQANAEQKDFENELSKVLAVSKFYDNRGSGNTFSEKVKVIKYKKLNSEQGKEFGNHQTQNTLVLKNGAIVYYIIRNTGTGTLEIDVNGTKGPNQYGRDLFFFILYNNGRVEPAYGEYYAKQQGNNMTYWKNNQDYGCDITNDGDGCAARIMEENWEMNY